MAATHQYPPILRLNHDILMRIIKMNANMFLDDDALKTTVITSAVCRAWRELMLSTPSLWGRLIDLNMLQDGTTDEWRYELMDRTGTAVLWIAARGLAIPDDDTGIMSFLADILENEWDRVQKISLDCIDGSYMNPRLPRWSALYLPAPNLQTFDVDFSEGDLSWEREDVDDEEEEEEEDKDSDTPLFDNDAPMLREFYARALRFDFGAPWLKCLHLLDIDIEITVDEVLTILEAAPALRELIICQAELGDSEEFAPTPDSSLPTKVSLPDLAHLVLFASFEAGTTLLARLDLPHGCTAKIHLTHGVNDDAEQRTSDSDSDESDDSHELEDSDESCRVGMQLQTVSHLARNIFRVCTPRKVLLVFSQNVLAFEVEDEDHTRDADDGCFFEFRVSCYGDHPPAPTTVYTATMTTAFLDAFTLPEELAQVTEFRLELENPNSNSLADSLAETIFGSPFIAQCLSESPSVTLLDAPGKTLAYFVEFQDSRPRARNAQADNTPTTIFPRVHTLKLDREAIAYFASDQARAQAQAQAQGALVEYLRARARDGCPIGTLDLTECDAESLPRLDFLEELGGLRVVWKRWGVKGKGVFEYVCGSGNPSRLRSFT